MKNWNNQLDLLNQRNNIYDFCCKFCLYVLSGLVVYPDGPLNLENKSEDMSELFRPFRTLLKKIRYGCLVFSNQHRSKQVFPLDSIRLL